MSEIKKNYEMVFDYDLNHLQSMVEGMLSQSRDMGASAAEAAVSNQMGYSVTVRKGEVETIEYNRDRGLGVTVYFGKSKGSASTTDFHPDAIQKTVAYACDIARYTSDDDCAGLADPEFLAREIPQLELYQPWDLAPEQAVEMALECEAAGLEEDSRVSNSDGAYISNHCGQRVYGNTEGFVGGYMSSRHNAGCTLIAGKGDDMQRDHWYSVSRNPAELEDMASIGKKAAQRTVSRLDARKIQTGKLPVVFSAEVARGLLGHFVRAVSGGALYRKSSFLLDSIGKQVFPGFISIDERPHLLQRLGSAPFDNEGVATKDRKLVEEGILQSYVLDSYSARRLGLQTTGNAGGVHNLYINSGGQSLSQLLKDMGKGLLITEVMGQGVNIVTGDYSRGASGFWVENGEIQYPVEEFTLANNLAEMFSRLVAVGSDVDQRGNLVSGSWLVESMTVAGM